MGTALRVTNKIPTLFYIDVQEWLWEHSILESCYQPTEDLQAGDIGLFYIKSINNNGQSYLDHAVIAVGKNTFFQKATLKSDSTFEMVDFEKLQITYNDRISEWNTKNPNDKSKWELQYFRFVNSPGCVLSQFQNDINNLSGSHLLKLAISDMESRIVTHDWTSKPKELKFKDLSEAMIQVQKWLNESTIQGNHYSDFNINEKYKDITFSLPNPSLMGLTDVNKYMYLQLIHELIYNSLSSPFFIEQFKKSEIDMQRPY